MDLISNWNNLCSYFSFEKYNTDSSSSKSTFKPKNISNDAAKTAINLLRTNNLQTDFLNYFLHLVSNHYHHLISFYLKLTNENFFELFSFLHNYYLCYLETLKSILSSDLFQIKDKNEFFLKELQNKLFSHINNNSNYHIPSSLVVPILENIFLDCNTPSSGNSNNYAKYSLFFLELEELRFNIVLETYYTKVLLDYIANFIEENIQSIFGNTEDGSSLLDFIISSIIKFSSNWFFLTRPNLSGETNPPELGEYLDKIILFSYEKFCRFRFTELFDIIREFPDSTPAVLDLKISLSKTKLFEELVSILLREFNRRLLHPGASTSDIITQYISAIKTLRTLEPTGVILDSITTPIRKYLQQREDTMRCLVASLISAPSETAHNPALSDELHNTNKIKHFSTNDNNEDGYDYDSELEDDHDEWHPDPVEADQSRSWIARHTNDIVGTLISIYGNQEAFMQEYQSQLAQRLLLKTDFEDENELINLELLKLRFGESAMRHCEVMIKDFESSRKLNSRFYNSMEFDDFLGVTVISSEYWPELQDEEFNLPPKVKSALEDFTSVYSKLKNDRDLTFSPNLGRVSLEIQSDTSSAELLVSPAQATVFLEINELCGGKLNAPVSLSALSQRIEAPEEWIQQQINYWLTRGFVREEKTDPISYILSESWVVEFASENAKDSYGPQLADMSSPQKVISIEAQMNKDIIDLEVRILGILANKDSFSLSAITQVLSSFTTGDAADFVVVTPALCEKALNNLISNGKISLFQGSYRMNK